MVLQVDLERLEFLVARGHAQVDDVGLVVTECSRNVAERTGTVMHDNAQPRRCAVAALPLAQIHPVGIDATR